MDTVFTSEPGFCQLMLEFSHVRDIISVRWLNKFYRREVAHFMRPRLHGMPSTYATRFRKNLAKQAPLFLPDIAPFWDWVKSNGGRLFETLLLQAVENEHLKPWSVEGNWMRLYQSSLEPSPQGHTIFDYAAHSPTAKQNLHTQMVVKIVPRSAWYSQYTPKYFIGSNAFGETTTGAVTDVRITGFNIRGCTREVHRYVNCVQNTPGEANADGGTDRTATFLPFPTGMQRIDDIGLTQEGTTVAEGVVTGPLYDCFGVSFDGDWLRIPDMQRFYKKEARMQHTDRYGFKVENHIEILAVMELALIEMKYTNMTSSLVHDGMLEHYKSFLEKFETDIEWLRPRVYASFGARANEIARLESKCVGLREAMKCTKAKLLQSTEREGKDIIAAKARRDRMQYLKNVKVSYLEPRIVNYPMPPDISNYLCSFLWLDELMCLMGTCKNSSRDVKHYMRKDGPFVKWINQRVNDITGYQCFSFHQKDDFISDFKKKVYGNMIVCGDLLIDCCLAVVRPLESKSRDRVRTPDIIYGPVSSGLKLKEFTSPMLGSFIANSCVDLTAPVGLASTNTTEIKHERSRDSAWPSHSEQAIVFVTPKTMKPLKLLRVTATTEFAQIAFDGHTFFIRCPRAFMMRSSPIRQIKLDSVRGEEMDYINRHLYKTSVSFDGCNLKIDKYFSEFV